MYVHKLNLMYSISIGIMVNIFIINIYVAWAYRFVMDLVANIWYILQYIHKIQNFFLYMLFGIWLCQFEFMYTAFQRSV